MGDLTLFLNLFLISKTKKKSMKYVSNNVKVCKKFIGTPPTERHCQEKIIVIMYSVSMTKLIHWMHIYTYLKNAVLSCYISNTMINWRKDIMIYGRVYCMF